MSRKRLFLPPMESLEARRLLSAGALDPSFGTAGKVTVNVPGQVVESLATAVQADGKTDVLGIVEHFDSGHNLQSEDFALVRLNFDGSLDTSFGPAQTGIVIQHVGSSDAQDQPQAIAIDGSGNILVVGSDNPLSSGSQMEVLRFLPSGNLDQSFGNGGIVDIDFGFLTTSAANGLTIQSNGRIVIVGQEASRLSNSPQFAIARLMPNGSRDNSFNGDGTQTIGFDDDSEAMAVVIDDTGTAASNPFFNSILVAGFEETSSSSHFAIARLKPNGDPDGRFGDNGTATLAPPHMTEAQAIAIRLQSNGSMLVAGTVGSATSNTGHLFAVARVTPHAALDPSFAGGGQGWATVGFSGDAFARGLLIGQNNRLIVGGTANFGIGLAAFTSAGLLDKTFGTGGRVTIANSSGGIAGMAYGPGNRFMTTGGTKFTTARFQDTGARLVHVQSINPNPTASESGPTPASFFVFREERLPVATRVFFNVGGTASAPNFFAVRNKLNDYSMDGMTFPIVVLGGGSPTPFVDIPANQTFTLVTLTPIDRKIGDGNKTATFAIKSDAAYDLASPSSLTVTIQDKVGQQTILNPTADAFVRDGTSANTNFGTSTQLNVKTDAANSGFNRRTFLKFDISSITNINSVKLQLFGNLSSTATSNVSAGVFAVADTSWSETGITFNNQPPIGANLATTTILDTTPRLYTWDITAYVKAQKAAGHNIITLAIKNLSTTSNFDIFNSREAASNRPQLVIS